MIPTRPYEPPPKIHVEPVKHWPWLRRGVVTQIPAFILLNTRTGKLHAEPRLADHERRRAGWYDPSRDLWVLGAGWRRRPTIIALHTNGGPWTESVEVVNEHLDLIAPTAQELLNRLAPIPGTADWDWTPQATAAIERIALASDRETQALSRPIPERPLSGIVVTLAEVLDQDPSLIDPTWAAMSDAELDRVADYFTDVTEGTTTTTWAPDHDLRLKLCEHLKIGWHENIRPGCYPLYQFSVVRARVDLRAQRDRLITAKTGLPTGPAIMLVNPDSLPGTFTASTTDADLVRLAARVDAQIAHDRQLSTTGTVDYLRALRDRARERVRREASDAGRMAAELERQLAALRATRNGLVAQVIGFHEAPEWEEGAVNYAEIGRLASMTRQGARTAFTKLAEIPGDDDDEALRNVAAVEDVTIGPATGDFCHEHYSWLCQAGQGKCQGPPATRSETHQP